MYVKGPYVVELLDVIMPRNLKTFDEIYVVMEVVEADLRKLARSNQFLGDKQIKTILYNTACGLKFVHSA